MSQPVTVEALRAALAARELVFHYQPKVSMLLGTACGAEALIRWRKPDGTMIGPGAFIPLAEDTGMITEITRQMLEGLVVDLAILRDVDPSLTVSFNASARDFADDQLLDAMLRHFDQGTLAAEAIEVELTETAVHTAGPALADRLCRLRSRGVALAMDDFGTGYSSIDSLSKLPFSTLKIDQGIVRRMETSTKDAHIVASSIRMGHRIGLDVVAEGIETESSFLALQAAGCSVGQGYWMGRPMPLEDLIELVRSGKRWPAGAIGLLHMATLDHLEWRKALIDAMVAGDGSQALAHFEIEPSECRLGRWYHGPGRRLSEIAAFRALEAPHIALHECAKQIIQAWRRGVRMGEILPDMRSLTEYSTRIIALLQELEHAVLTRMTDTERRRTLRVLSTRPPAGQ